MTLEEHALKFVNEILKMSDCKPIKILPKGIRRSACDCPIANAIENLHVGKDAIWSPSRKIFLFDLPREVRRFVKAFDAGKYPHLIKMGYK